jgi:hypothetical protein
MTVNLPRRASGTAELGSCLTDATREGRSRRAARKFAAMPTPERLRYQSSRHADPAVPYKSSVSDLQQTFSYRAGSLSGGVRYSQCTDLAHWFVCAPTIKVAHYQTVVLARIADSVTGDTVKILHALTRHWLKARRDFAQ